MSTRLIPILVVVATLLAAPSSSVAGLLGTSSTVVFTEPGFDSYVDVVGIFGGVEVLAGFGRIGTEVMLDFEQIDIQNESIVFDIRGDGPAHPDNAAYQTTGLGPLAQYQIKYLTWLDQPGRIVDVNVTLSNVIDVVEGQEVLFDDHSVTLLLGTLGVLDQAGGPDIGQVTIDLIVELPEVGGTALLLAALGALAFSRSRTR